MKADATQLRYWTLYGPDGDRLHELQATAEVIRATLPGALIDAATGSVRLPAVGVGRFGGVVYKEVDDHGDDC